MNTLLKRNRFAAMLVFAVVLAFVVNVSSAFATTYGPYFVSSQENGVVMGTKHVQLNSTATALNITGIKIYGVHAGQPANFAINIYNSSGTLVLSNIYSSDVDGLSITTYSGTPGALFTIDIVSRTAYLMQGGYYINVDGSTW